MASRGPMFRVDVRDALDVLCPRFHSYNRHDWPVNGHTMLFNAQKVRIQTQAHITKLITLYDKSGLVPPIERVDVSRDNLWTIQRVLTVSTMTYLLRKLWKWQDWKRDRLPIYVRYQGKLIIWNGTHRSVICRLAGRRCRGRVIDLDKFSKWVAAHPDRSMWNVKKVLTFGPKKGKKRRG